MRARSSFPSMFADHFHILCGRQSRGLLPDLHSFSRMIQCPQCPRRGALPFVFLLHTSPPPPFSPFLATQAPPHPSHPWPHMFPLPSSPSLTMTCRAQGRPGLGRGWSHRELRLGGYATCLPSRAPPCALTRSSLTPYPGMSDALPTISVNPWAYVSLSHSGSKPSLFSVPSL